VDFACGLAANQDARARKNCATAAILDSGALLGELQFFCLQGGQTIRSVCKAGIWRMSEMNSSVLKAA
jgi:hypothetical protein